MSTIASLSVDLGLDSAKFIQGLHKARAEHKDFTERLRGISEGASAGLEALGLQVNSSFSLETLIDKAREAQDTSAKLEAVLRATGEAAGISASGMDAIAEGLQRVTVYSTEAAKGAETVLATFTHVRGAQFREAIAAAADLATVFGVDLSSAAEKVGQALENPGEGLKRLAKMGVEFSDAQTKVITKLVETGQVAAAQEEILKAINQKVGGSAAAAAKTANGALTQLQNSFTTLAERIGSVFLPAAQKVQVALNGIAAAAKSASSGIAGIKQIPAAASAAGNFAATAGAASRGGLAGLGEGAAAIAAPLAVAAGIALMFADNLKTVYETSQVESSSIRRSREEHENALAATKAHADALLALRDGAGEAAASIDKLVKDAQNPIDVTSEYGERFSQLSRSLREASDQYDAFADKVRKAGGGDKETIAKLADMKAGIAKINDLRAQSAEESIAQKAADKLKEAAEQWRSAVLSPAEKFQQQIAELQKLAAGGVDRGLVGRGLDKAFTDYKGTLGQQSERQSFGALEQGSAAAYSAALKNAQQDTSDPRLDVAKQQLEEAKRQSGLLDKLSSAPAQTDTTQTATF